MPPNPADGPSGRTLLFVGTGFFVTREGHVLTNANITGGADRVWVEHDGVAYAAQPLGNDPVSNLALIQLTTLPKKFSFLRTGDATDLAPMGSFLESIGCELGQDPGPSLGIVTGWNTNYGERALPTTYLRTDIASDGGEGGSPVFDLNGRFVGLMVASLPEIRSSFVLPAKAVQRVLDDLMSSGHVSYGYLGIQTRERADPKTGRRVFVEGVEPKSPADTAGIKPGDILTAIGNTPIRGDEDLRNATFFTRPGIFLTLHIRRGDQDLDLPLRVGMRLEDLAPKAQTNGKDTAPRKDAKADTQSDTPAEATPKPMPAFSGPQPSPAPARGGAAAR